MESIKIEWGNKNYKAEWGVVKFKGNAESVAHEIESIGNSVTRRQMVDYAEQNADSELHKCFEWDDEVAADHYRIQQAGAIISSLHIAILHKDKETEKTEVRYFSMLEHRGSYKKTEVIVKNLDEYQALLSKAKDELQWFKKKYATLSELEQVFEAIDSL